MATDDPTPPGVPWLINTANQQGTGRFGDDRLPLRLWARLRLEPCPTVAGDCWIWTGKLVLGLYGRTTREGKDIYVHRWTYYTLVGPIPSGLDLDHLCRRPACCYPGHLQPVTRLENVRRGALWALRTHCVNGHPLSSENVYLRRGGHRMCRACGRAVKMRLASRAVAEGQCCLCRKRPPKEGCKCCASCISRSARNAIARRKRKQDEVAQ